MSLNIKDPEAHRLAQQVAEQTGETLTRAVTEALRERLARLNRERTHVHAVDDRLAIGRRCAASVHGAPVDHAALLYDDVGLPE